MRFDVDTGIVFTGRKNMYTEFNSRISPYGGDVSKPLADVREGASAEEFLDAAARVGERNGQVNRLMSVFHVVGTALELMRQSSDQETYEAIYRRLERLEQVIAGLPGLDHWDKRTLQRRPRDRWVELDGFNLSIRGPRVITGVRGFLPGLLDGASWSSDWELALVVQMDGFTGRPRVHPLEASVAAFVVTASWWSEYLDGDGRADLQRAIGAAASHAASIVRSGQWNKSASRNETGTLAFQMARLFATSPP